MTSAPRHDREPGTRRKAYSKPRNARRDAVKARQAALALTWVPAPLSYSEMRRLRNLLNGCVVKFAVTGQRREAAEMQRLRSDVMDSWNKPLLPSATVGVARTTYARGEK